MTSKGNQYRTVAVIGCQSSGKSTLLNLLFQTNFDVMDSDHGRTQTTKGIWMAINQDRDILVFDIEGTDSKERGEQRLTFEQTTSLFALAIADVLLINMWTTDIGRYGASNYGLLKVIFEVNLKLFDQKSSKKLLFVLRDFDDRGNNYEKIQGILQTDLTRIWSEIYKPDKFANSKPTDFFQFEYCMMPHKMYQEKQFYEKAAELKARFSVDAKDSLFLTDADQKNIPLDGLHVYIDKSWESIKDQKELNLPDQRAMVANYRCIELKEEALQVVDQAIRELQQKCDKAYVADFREQTLTIMTKASDYYSDVAKQYDKTVFAKIQKELVASLLTLLFSCFDSQLKMLRQTTYSKVENEVKKLERKELDEICDNLSEILQALLDQSTKSFALKSDSLILEGSGWHSKVDAHKVDLQSNLLTLVNNCKSKLLDKLSQTAQKQHEQRLKDLIHDQVNNLNEHLASTLRDAYVEVIDAYNSNLNLVLLRGFGLDQQTAYDCLTKFEKQAYEYSVNELRLVFKDQTNSVLLRKFKDEFFKDESGRSRHWPEIEEAKIQELFDVAKAKVGALLNEFRKVVIPQNLTVMQTPNPDSSIQIEGLIKDPSMRLSLANSSILSEKEINFVNSKFLEDIDFSYEEALARHRNIAMQNIPIWMYVLLAWFASDNVLGWLSSPILFYPLVVIGSLLFAAFQMGMMPVLLGAGLPILKAQVNGFLAKTSIPFRM